MWGTVILLSVILGLITAQNAQVKSMELPLEVIDTANAVIPQKIESSSSVPVEVSKLYHEGEMVGIVRDSARLQRMFENVYNEEYREDYPNSKLGFSDDVYLTKTLSTNTYENKDDEIFNYIQSKDLFAVETNKVVFSNGAVINVKDIKQFENAQEAFIKNFIDEDAYQKIKKREEVPFGDRNERELSIQVNETTKYEKTMASKATILDSEEAILTFLNYGYEPEMKTYTVEKFDTVPGVGSKNGMSASQIVSINSDQLKSEDQIIEEGMELNVTQFDSPFTVEIVREYQTVEQVYPEEPERIDDPELPKGDEVVDTIEKAGTENVTYNITYVNGVQAKSVEVSRKESSEPVRGVIRVGTKEAPKKTVPAGGGYGGYPSGIFRWPLDSGGVICAYGCYGGHRGVDFQPVGVYGSIYSIGSGVVSGKGNDPSGWGFWVRVNHGNGYQSLYAHMPGPSVVAVGQSVGAGQYLGQVGDTGYATTPHLHLEIWDSGGNRLDACQFLSC